MEWTLATSLQQVSTVVSAHFCWSSYRIGEVRLITNKIFYMFYICGFEGTETSNLKGWKKQPNQILKIGISNSLKMKAI